MSMSLDGFIAGPDDRAGQELGRDGGRLFNWLDDREGDGSTKGSRSFLAQWRFREYDRVTQGSLSVLS
jgi:hypothetical protein